MKNNGENEKKKNNMLPEEKVWNEWRFHSTVWHFSGENAKSGRLGYSNIPSLAEKLILKYTLPGSRLLCFDKPLDSVLSCKKDLVNRKFAYADFHEFTTVEKEQSMATGQIADNTMKFDGIFATLPWWLLIENSYSPRQIHEEAEHLLSRNEILLSKSLKILQDEGFFILNTKDVVADRVIPLGALLMQQSLEVGFNLWDVIHYDFNDNPSSPGAFSSFDYLLVLQKRQQGWKFLPTGTILDLNPQKTQNSENYSKLRENHNCKVWNFNVGAESRTLTHGYEYHSEDRYIKSKRKIYEKTLFAGKLVPQLVRRLILEYSQPQDTIFDFFVGTGTVILEGVHCGRKSFGIDLNPAAVELTRRKILAYQENWANSQALPTWSVEKGNATERVPLPEESIDLVFAHPPYWGLVKYTDYAEDLSNMRLEEYLWGVQAVFREAFRILKLQGFLVVIIGDKRKSGLVPLGSYLALLGASHGFWLWDLILNDTEFGGKQHNYFAQIKSKMYKFHLTDHDYILVFKKHNASVNTNEP
ncbi:MAG: DNA methyltransferase [Candidatus Hodarchaeota archaeon]